MAGTSQQFWKRKKKNLSPQESAEPVDSVVHDSLGNVAVDTTKMDSLQKAIVRYNKAIDDSIRLDSINRAKASGAKEVFLLTTKTADWFERLGFVSSDISSIPEKRRKIWTPERGSKVLTLKL